MNKKSIEPSLRGAELDKHILSSLRCVSVFWVTETQARAKRITDLEKRGILELDYSLSYPRLGVKKFEADRL